ncbi:MAG: hypothetical protein MUE73_12735 [Planctomycetes bacterium]|jgi:hypothetical protein|nr:hypothetical protein [Planctomycetota bacterium]
MIRGNVSSASRALFVAGLVLLVAPATASAHLCNDVFAQAKDNLAVKVDIRDGQLRIAKEATFRVYLLNTMDRPIANINLEVRCEQFAPTVKPSPEWRGFPQLKNLGGGGKKEYFEVTLARKPGVKDGRYRIELHLYNGQNPKMVFKTLDLGASADEFELPRLPTIKVDGAAGSAEWKKALLVSDFYTYEQNGRYFENVRASDQPRYRLAFDDNFLYALFSVRKGAAGEDTATLLVAKDPDSAPVALSFNLRTGEPKGDIDTGEIFGKLSTSKESFEVRIPRKLLGLDGPETTGFFVNFTRTADMPDARGNPARVTSYWRGNRFSERNPVVYARVNFTTE